MQPALNHPSSNDLMFDQLNLNEDEKKEYLKYKSLLYDLTSGSEDEWSEPDKSISQSRIGLDVSKLRQNLASLPQCQQKFKSKKIYSSGEDTVSGFGNYLIPYCST